MKNYVKALMAGTVLCLSTAAWANKAPPPPPLPTQPTTLPGKGEGPAKTLTFVGGGIALSGALLAGGLMMIRRGRRE